MASIYRWGFLVLAGLLMPALLAGAQTQAKIITLGSNLTPDQRRALLVRFGANEGTDKILTITTPEMVAAMQDIIPVDGTYQSVSSTALTCGKPGSGLHVTTEHIMGVTAGMYAGALLTAGIHDAELVVAAPPDADSAGMTALTGIFKGFDGGACGRSAITPELRQLSYRWLAVTAALGRALNDQNAAAKFVLTAQNQLIDGGKSDPAAVEPAFNGASGAIGINVPPDQQPAILDLLRRIAEADIDWGNYTSGWDLQEINLNEFRLAPHGSPVLPAGSTLTGKVRSAISPTTPLTIEATGRTTPINLRANNVTVTRNDQPAQLADLQTGDTVTIQIADGNVAQHIEARGPTAAAPTPPTSTATGHIVVGTVADNNEGKLTLATADGQQQFVVPTTAYVTRAGQEAKVAAIQPQDSTVVVLDRSGNVLSVFTRPKGAKYTIEGKVDGPALAESVLRVAVGTQKIAIDVPSAGATITRNQHDAKITDFKANDQIVVRFDPGGRAVAIDATSVNLWAGLSRWVLPVVVVAVVGLLLAFSFVGRPGGLPLMPPGRRAVRSRDADDPLNP